MMTKKRWILTIFIFTVAIAYYLYTKPVTVEKEISGVIYSTDTNFEKQTTVRINGKLYKGIVLEDKFVGELVIDDDIKIELSMKSEGDSFLYIQTTTNSDGNIRTIGSIHASEDLSMIWMNLKEIDERYHTNSYIAAPADNKETGNEVANKILGF